jgi:murein L,D-transpeptidase YcbB/YkuD
VPQISQIATTSLLAALCAVAYPAVARAQLIESAKQFWINEARRNAGPAADSYYGQAYGYGRDEYGAYPRNGALGYGEPYRPRNEAPPPQVEVKSPQYYDYVPDKPVPVDLGGVCQHEVASNSDAAATGFAQACGVAPSITLRLLPEVAKALIAYYSQHPGFIWIEQGKPGAKALAAVAALAASDRFGLDPADYQVALPQRSDADDTARQADALKFELALSAKVMTYVLDARRGRVAANRISGYHDLPRNAVDLAAIMVDIAQADDVGAALAQQNPDNARFRALVATLARLRAQDAQRVVIPEGTYIKPGGSDPALGQVIAAIAQAAPAALKDKHADALAAAGKAEQYTPQLVALVRDFQRAHDLTADGVIGPKTIRTLTAESSQDKVEKIRLAMERLRWLPRELGSRYVFLNEPAFEVAYVNGNREPLTMRAVIGKPSTQTYFFTAHIKDIVYNPYWNVPRSIVVNEMLPHLWRDPSYLNRQGYEVTNARGREIASADVDWAGFARKNVSVDVRQPPGRSNALGRLKIEFPNAHAIYMHDTPAKSLFEHEARAFSHGCVRLQYPRKMAAALLGKSVDYVDGRIAQGDNAHEQVAGEIPVYLGYFTAWPDVHGAVHFYEDIYGRDGHLKEALAKTEAARHAK